MTLSLVALLALTGCNPPVELNEAPSVDFISPVNDDWVATGPTELRLIVGDQDGDTLSLEVSGPDGVLGTLDGLGSGETAVVPVDLVGTGSSFLSAVVADARGLSSQVQIVVNLNAPPELPTIEITPESPTSLDDIEARMVGLASDPEGSAITYRWKWQRRGSSVVTAEGNDFPAPLPAEETERDDVWVFTVDVTEDNKNGAPNLTVTYEVEVVIGNAAPFAPAAEVIPAQPHPASPLQCVLTSAATDPDGDTVSYVYSWTRNSVAESIDTALVPGDQTAPGDTWECTAAATDGSLTGAGDVSSVTVLPREFAVDTASVLYEGDESGLRFGEYAVGVSLDNTAGDDLFVGLPESEKFGDGYGLAAVFRGGSLPGGSLEARTIAIPGFPGARLGAGVEPVPSVDGTTGGDVLVGVAGSAGLTTPSVFLFRGDSLLPGNLDFPYAFIAGTEENIVEGSDAVLFEHDAGSLGFGVAMAGSDFDGDGAADIAIGDESLAGTGAIYLFSSTDIAGATDATSFAPRTVSTDDADIIESDESSDLFGTVISGGYDVDGDGSDDLLVGAPARSSGEFAWVFTGADLGGLDTGVSLTPADASVSFANANVPLAATQATLLPDLDGDGYAEMAIASPRTRLDGEDLGGAVGIVFGEAAMSGSYNFNRTDVDVFLYGREASSGFGSRMVDVGDLTGDGIAEIAVAAPFEGATERGAVHVFTGRAILSAASTGGGLLAGEAEVSLIGAATGDQLTLSGRAGDLDQDGTVDLLATSPTGPQGLLYVFLSGRR